MPWESHHPERAGRRSAADRSSELPASDDNEPFAGFYERSARPLWAYLARVLLRDPALADDLMQESYRALSMRRTSAGWRSGRAPVSFPHRHQSVARSLAAAQSLHRSTRFPKSFLRRSATSAQSDSQAMLGPAHGAACGRATGNCLWLAYAEGYSHREIAEVTGLGIGEHSAAAVSRAAQDGAPAAAGR